MSDERKRPGPKPEIFKVPLKFSDAVKAALETPLQRPKKPKKKS
jgi:hypothetical protein